MDRHILVVDDEINILNSLERLLEELDDMIVYRASNGAEGLIVLQDNPQIGVVVSDQRMPNMTGTEFLRAVKGYSPEVVRIILSGYSELNTITDAINQGSIFKFVSKPWNEDILINVITEAFEYYELAFENKKLTEELKKTNERLEQFNLELEELVNEKTRNLQMHVASLKIYHEALEHCPFGVIGLDESETIVLENKAARALLSKTESSLLGLPLEQALDAEWSEVSKSVSCFFADPAVNNMQAQCEEKNIYLCKFGKQNSSIGMLITIV